MRVHPEHSRSIYPLLPPDEAVWVVETDTDVIVPVPVPGMDGIGALAVGHRFDGRVVRSVDVPFLEALGSMAGLATARLRVLVPAEAPPEPPPAWECPICRSLAGAGEPPECECGAAYVETDVPNLLAGNFRLTRHLGTGGMGAAYLARDLRLDRDVAVKTLAGTSVLRLMQLKPEAWAMATVTHPAVAQIHGIETWRGRPFLVVEFLPGGTLEDRLLHRPVAPSEAVAVIAALAAALAALHETGFMHGTSSRAISGSGRTGRGSCWISAWLARRTTGQPWAAPCATCRPKRCPGTRPTKPTTCGSLCVVLYEMVSGQHPFPGGSASEVAERIRRQRVAGPAGPPAGPVVGEAVIAFAASVLAAPRPSRPASARAFAEELHRIRWNL